MRVLLVGPDLESNLSLRYLASSLRAAGHQPTIATFDTAADTPEVLRAAACADLIGLSMCFQVRAPEFLSLARQLKAAAPARPVIAGGHFASCAAAELLDRHPELDVIVIHEGEQAIVELANLGAELIEGARGLRGVAVRHDGRAQLTPARPILAELDQLPNPDRAGPARLVAGVPTAYLMGSRGCVNACDYCCITTLHRMAPGRRFRQRSPEKVVGEMAELFHQRGVRQFVFHDDNFLVPSFAHNSARIERFAKSFETSAMKDFALVLKCSPRDAERRILSRLKELGLIRIFMGIESGTQCGLDAIGRKQTVAEAERALSLCEELDISSQYTLITFHPEATAETMLADLAFAKRHPAHPLNYCRAEVYAGTPLERRLKESGRAIGSYLGHIYEYTDPRVQRVWEVGSELFAGRCWGKDEILGQAIRLDHQVTVVRRFYDGRDVDRLVRRFRTFQTDLNLGTAELFTELVELCADPSLTDASLEKGRASLERRERQSREALLRRLCELRADIDECTGIALPAEFRSASTRKPRRAIVARHAAAVAVALGLVGVSAEGADTAGKKRPAVDAGVTAVPVKPKEPPFRPDHGVAEAAPPPFDKRRIQVDEGVAEAAPPPWDPNRDRLRHDIGVAEAAPPPFDPPRAPLPAFSDLSVTAPEGTTIYLSDVGKVSGRVNLPGKPLKELTFTVNGKTDDRLFKATLTRVLSANRTQVALKITSDPKVRVTMSGEGIGETPVTTMTGEPRRAVRLRLTEVQSGGWIELSVVVGDRP